jgi:DNA sulfur modification protein DndC
MSFSRGANKKESAFSNVGMATAIRTICEEIRELYLWDEVPWVVGYSGGKDSTAVLQLVWLAVRELSPQDRRKSVYVISTDTLVEQPVVATWVDLSHAAIRQASEEQKMPIIAEKLVPETKDTFWVNLIGKGYPAPRKLFRWCTSRLKINPSNKFIRTVVRENGEAILVLGTRKAESQRRALNMKRHEAKKVRDRLTPNANLPNSLIYTPIEDWTNDDVWLFLMQFRNPWGHSNKELLGMYQGASEDGECPLVLDTSSPSCGDSRFGCWVCTLVDKDRSMEAMIRNDDEKVWMIPLLELRNDLGDFSRDRSRRDYRRMSGRVQLFHGDLVRGPYTKNTRDYWLERVLRAQMRVREIGPEEFRCLDLISIAELKEIRRIWLYEKHEFDDSLPRIYREVTGEEFPDTPADDSVLGSEDWELLREVCGKDEDFFLLLTRLLDTERQFRGMVRRSGIYEALEDELRIGQYGSEESALLIRQNEERRRSEAANGKLRGNKGQPQPLFHELRIARKA